MSVGLSQSVRHYILVQIILQRSMAPRLSKLWQAS